MQCETPLNLPILQASSLMMKSLLVNEILKPVKGIIVFQYLQNFGALEAAMSILALTLAFNMWVSYHNYAKDKRFRRGLEERYEDHSQDKLDQDHDT